MKILKALRGLSKKKLEELEKVSLIKVHVCKSCRDRFASKKELLDHYGYVHPGLSFDWILKDLNK